jgi:hypothetical protein
MREHNLTSNAALLPTLPFIVSMRHGQRCSRTSTRCHWSNNASSTNLPGSSFSVDQ